MWSLYREVGGCGRAGKRPGCTGAEVSPGLSGSPSEQEALANEELAELSSWFGW